MPAPAQPAIDALEAALTSLQADFTAVKAERDSFKAQVDAGVLTDAQTAKLRSLQDMAAGLGK